MKGLPGGASGKEPAYQRKRLEKHRFNPRDRKTPWRRQWQPAPIFLPGESLVQRNLSGYSPWGRKESDTTEATQHARTHAHTHTHTANKNYSPETCRIVSDFTKLKKLALCKKAFLKNPTLPPTP